MKHTPIKQISRKAVKKHTEALNKYLTTFFDFMGKKPQPTNEEVRIEFTRLENEWKMYCLHNGLGIRTSLLFNARVSYEWYKPQTSQG